MMIFEGTMLTVHVAAPQSPPGLLLSLSQAFKKIVWFPRPRVAGSLNWMSVVYFLSPVSVAKVAGLVGDLSVYKVSVPPGGMSVFGPCALGKSSGAWSIAFPSIVNWMW